MKNFIFCAVRTFELLEKLSSNSQPLALVLQLEYIIVHLFAIYYHSVAAKPLLKNFIHTVLIKG